MKNVNVFFKTIMKNRKICDSKKYPEAEQPIINGSSQTPGYISFTHTSANLV